MKIPIAFSYKAMKIKNLFNKTQSKSTKEMLYFTGEGESDIIGKEFVNYFIKYGNLKPTDTLLDVGCGVGRMAIPLTKFLTSGHYEGFDLFKDGIIWCKKNINSKFPNFNFQVIDVYNKNYNPFGKYKSSELKFPYSKNSFDFICANSVFTHLLPKDFENYVSEIQSTIKKNGVFFSTFFIMNKESEDLIAQNKSLLQFKYFNTNEFATLKDKLMEHAIAYKESYIKEILKQNGFQDITIYFGNWCGRKNFLSMQDIIIAKKSDSI